MAAASHVPDPPPATPVRCESCAERLPLIVVPGHERDAGAMPAIVGRERELRAFEAALEDVRQGRFRAIAVLGEPGIGKTRLLSEVAARARRRGHLVLCARATELECELPFGLLAERVRR